jgi:tetratricopeptide (TPR) repeat protein
VSRAVLPWSRPRVAPLRLAAVLSLAALMLAAGACATGRPQPPAPPSAPAGPPAEDSPFLVHPLEGWDGPVSPAQRSLLDEGFAAVEAADAELALAVAAEANGGEPPSAVAEPYPPAAVLAAQADLLERRPGDARARLEPLAEAHPSYLALQLALGRAADAAGDLVGAFGAFQRVAGRSPRAAERAAELRPRAVEVLTRRVGDALARGAVGTAEEALGRLREWLPEATATHLAAADVARARGDRRAELAALRVLVPRAAAPASDEPALEESALDERALSERQAELELEVGDSKAGLDLFEALAARYPDDPLLAERLAYAKFRWRIAQMPPRVAQVAASPALERGDMAVLLYWLVPRVRSTRGATARIASDILDDPRREEIARVLNLGLMDMDTSVHRFYPQRPIRRPVALRAVLRVLAAFGGAACAAPAAAAAASDLETICAAAFDCGLLRGEEACVPREGMTGAEAVDLVRRALARMAAADGGAGGAGE